MERYVICYDITDDKRRRKVVETLKDHGHRVQYSVFECNVDAKTLVRLKFKLMRLRGKGDSIIVYPLCGSCVQQVEVMGVCRGDDEGFIL